MLKRGLDIAGSLIGLLLLSPVLLIVSLLVWMFLGRPVLFRQRRPGLNGSPFLMVKFRTMNDRRNSGGMLLPDADRLTALGKWLRATSLDEIPGLWNVLRGDMSLVGPRPLLMQYLPLYSPEQARRHLVKPGLTGWAQVNGRNALTWDEKFALDTWYVDNAGFALDIRIIAITIWRVLRRDGISASGDATMPVFTGSQSR